MQVDNKLAETCPVSEAELVDIAVKYLSGNADEVSESISPFINALTPHFPNHKLIVNVTHLKNPDGAVCVSGAHWDPQHDGTWVKHLGNNLITVSWVKA